MNRLSCAVLDLDPDQWPDIFTFEDRDLDELQGPITRIANKRAALARVVEESDEIVVSLKLGRWAAESIQTINFARKLPKDGDEPPGPEDVEEGSAEVAPEAPGLPDASGIGPAEGIAGGPEAPSPSDS